MRSVESCRQSSESTLKSLNRHRLQIRTQLFKLPLRLTPATLHIFFSQHARDVSRHFAAVPVEQFPEPYGVHRLDVVGDMHVRLAAAGPLLPVFAAQRTRKDMIRVFENYAQPYAQEFVPRLALDILEVIYERKFPKRPMTQANFLADSLAGRPNVAPRTSRDIRSKPGFAM